MSKTFEMQRHLEIMGILEEQKGVKIVDLSKRFGVSSNTIRRDFAKLKEQGLIRIGRGGAIIKKDTIETSPFGLRKDIYLEEKAQIAQRAVDFSRARAQR